MEKERKLHFGALIHGVGGHISIWKHPRVKSNQSVDLNFYVKQAQVAEKGKFDLIFIADGLFINEKSIPHFLNRFEPVTILSALAMVTQNIGLVGTISTTYSEPFNVSRQLASLDLISNGRAGWNVVTTPLEGTALNFNKTIEEHPDHATRYEIADEYLKVAKGLWDSWGDDAFIADVENDQFVDLKKLHVLDHTGKYFSVRGPLNISRSKQGHPVIFQAGSSNAGVKLAAKHTDAVFTNYPTLELSKEFYQKVKDEVVKAGRNSNEVLIFPAIAPIIGDTYKEAERKYNEVKSLVTIERALDYLGRFFDHHDFSQYDLDAPFPDIGDIGENAFRSTTERIKKEARENGLTLKEVALRETTPKPVFFGTAKDVADLIEKWFVEKAADGFMFTVAVPHALEDFVEKVVPILQERGLYRTEYSANTLRGNLGIPFKENKNTKQYI